MKITWKDSRRPGAKYVTNAAFDSIPGFNGYYNRDYKPTFTMLPHHTEDLYSMEQLFLDHYNDPTEYSFVQDVFEGDIAHWETFKASTCIQRFYEQWKKKAEAKLASEAITKIVNTAFDDNNKNQFSALKYLVERNGKASVGRPKKAKKEVDDRDDILADIKRLKA